MAQSNAAKAKKRNEIPARRRQILLYVRSGLTQQETAAALGVSEATISLDLAALRREAQAAALGDTLELIERECRQLDADEAALRADLIGPKGEIRLFVLDRIGAIQDRRGRWRGFDQAPKGASFADLDAALERLGL